MAGPATRCSTPQPWGSWFEFSLPALPVGDRFADRALPGQRVGRLRAVVAGVDGWQDRLRTWGVTLAVVAGEDQAAFGDRLRAAGWLPVYHDDDGTILDRAGPSGSHG